MENKYWENAEQFKEKLIYSIKQIFKVYGNELELKIEDLNLLERDDNCIETSTAIGYCMEEFIVSKLITYTKTNNTSDLIVERENLIFGTQNSSYDFLSHFQGELFLINIKANKGNNNAIAAIQQLHKDYVINNPETIKHYMVLKINYDIVKNDIGKKVISILGIESFFLEEIDFSKGHKQDNRNWSKNFNANSGRLQISKKSLDNKINAINISYENTKLFIDNIYQLNKKI